MGFSSEGVKTALHELNFPPFDGGTGDSGTFDDFVDVVAFHQRFSAPRPMHRLGK